MTHPITGHSDRCLCERCEQVVDVPALIAQRDELTERVAACERAIADLRKLVHELNQRTIGMAK